MSVLMTAVVRLQALSQSSQHKMRSNGTRCVNSSFNAHQGTRPAQISISLNPKPPRFSLLRFRAAASRLHAHEALNPTPFNYIPSRQEAASFPLWGSTFLQDPHNQEPLSIPKWASPGACMTYELSQHKNPKWDPNSEQPLNNFHSAWPRAIGHVLLPRGGSALGGAVGKPYLRLPIRPLGSPLLGLPYRILSINHKKELLRGLWVPCNEPENPLHVCVPGYDFLAYPRKAGGFLR